MSMAKMRFVATNALLAKKEPERDNHLPLLIFLFRFFFGRCCSAAGVSDALVMAFSPPQSLR
jgi:hypothetical protein